MLSFPSSVEPIFNAIAPLLPQIAEEGELHKAMAVEDVDRSLSSALDCSMNEARHHRLVVEKLFSVLRVLDRQSLSRPRKFRKPYESCRNT